MTGWLVDGRPAQNLAVTDRGLAYGDGLFETIAVRSGQLRFFDRHLERLQQGAARLGIPVPARETMHAECTAVARACDHGALKLILTRGTGQRGYAPSPAPQTTRIIGIFPGQPPAAALYAQGVTVRYCATPIAENPALAGIKTLNRLEQVLARAEWHDEAVHEGLMMTLDGRVICGTMTNLFAVRNGELVTPALDNCGIRGIMRGVVLETAVNLGLVTAEVALQRADLEQAQEWFLTNSQVGIWPVSHLDGQSRAPGAVTRQLMQAIGGLGVRESTGA